MIMQRVFIDDKEYFLAGGACAAYVHVQRAPACEWDVVTPPGDAMPLVQVWHSDGYQMMCRVDYVEAGKIKLSFTTPETGTAIIINIKG